MSSVRRKKVLVALSGGVDSSVSAALLKDQGFDVIGATLQVWDYSKGQNTEGYGTCCSHVDVQDARSVCDVLNIPFYVLNTEDVFEDKVIRPFVQSYLKAETPIPCTACNTFLKFSYLINKMLELECDFLATGHYAKILPLEKEGYGLFAGDDSLKDQSYFLFSLKREILPRLLFPIGSLNKKEVREIALQKALPVFAKKDSTGICFVGSGSYKSFVEHYAKQHKIPLPKKGLLRRFPDGKSLGEHPGIHGFTIGQRKGLGLSSTQPLFVVHIDRKSGEVWLAEEQDLYSHTAEVSDLNWLEEVKDGELLNVKVRFRDTGSAAHIYKQKDSCLLKFIKPKKALTPGQSAVFYRGSRVLGGGSIQQREFKAPSRGAMISSSTQQQKRVEKNA